MQKRILFLLVAAFLVPLVPADARTAHAVPAVLLKESPHGYVLSVHACSEPLENLLRTVGRHCGIHISLRHEHNRLNPVHIHFNDLPLEHAIRKLIQAAGITNYLIRYRGGANAPQSIAEIMSFGSGKMPEEATHDAEPMCGEQHCELSADFKPTADAADEYSQKIASFKDRYLWEDEETCTWAIYLLSTMPEEAKDVGLDAIMKQLDMNSGNEGAVPVNAAIFYQAIEDAAPPTIAPVMMQQVRRLSERYHNGRAQQKAGASINELYPRSMHKEGR